MANTPKIIGPVADFIDKESATVQVKKKKGVVQTVIDDKMLQQLVSGSIWTQDTDQIISVRNTLEKFMKTVKASLKMFDEELKNQRKIHGDDHLKEVNFFRKPRTPKDGVDTSLMDDLSFGEDEDEEDDETSE